MLAVEVRCVNRCGTGHVVKVHADDYESFLKGYTTGQTFPYLTPADRSLLLTKDCGAGRPPAEPLDALALALRSLCPGVLTPVQLRILASGILRCLSVFNVFAGSEGRQEWLDKVLSGLAD